MPGWCGASTTRLHVLPGPLSHAGRGLHSGPAGRAGCSSYPVLYRRWRFGEGFPEVVRGSQSWAPPPGWAGPPGTPFFLHRTALRRTGACCPSAEGEDGVVTKCEGRAQSGYPRSTVVRSVPALPRMGQRLLVRL